MEDIFLGLIDCADESILTLNPILNKNGIYIKGYDYDEFVKSRIGLFTSKNIDHMLSHSKISNYYVGGEKNTFVPRHNEVLDLVKSIGVAVDFDRPSFRDKIYFIEMPGKNQVSIDDLGNTHPFEIICYKLQQFLSIYTNYPLRINHYAYEGQFGWRYQHPEHGRFKYPYTYIFPNTSIHGNPIVEDKLFADVLTSILNKIDLQTLGPRVASFESIDYKITGKDYIDFAIQLYYQSCQIVMLNPNQILNKKMKLTLFVSCLESLLSTAAIQISHTISRHFAVLLWNPSTFYDHYKLMKLIYELRSIFIHGANNTSIKAINKKIKSKTANLKLEGIDTLDKVLDYLELNVKVIIQLVILENKSKNELFDALNARGLDPNEYYSESPFKPKNY